jgi:hypothetical protein
MKNVLQKTISICSIIGFLFLVVLVARNTVCQEKKTDLPALSEVEQLQIQTVMKDLTIYQQQYQLLQVQMNEAQANFQSANNMLNEKVAQIKKAHGLDPKQYDVQNDNGVYKFVKAEKKEPEKKVPAEKE